VRDGDPDDEIPLPARQTPTLTERRLAKEMADFRQHAKYPLRPWKELTEDQLRAAREQLARDRKLFGTDR
jgi:hypothetical protein